LVASLFRCSLSGVTETFANVRRPRAIQPRKPPEPLPHSAAVRADRGQAIAAAKASGGHAPEASGEHFG